MESNSVEPKRETVILVHGTFAQPQATGPLQWYQPGSDFCHQLDGLLAKLGSSARCWAHCDKASYFFWSGANSWIARTQAAERLAVIIDDLCKAGWRCHIVAHSHGGSVVLEALQTQSLQSGKPGIEYWREGNVVILGTPITESMDYPRFGYPTLTKRHVKGSDILISSVFAVPLACWVLARLVFALFHEPGLLLTSIWFWIALVVGIVAVGFIGFLMNFVMAFARGTSFILCEWRRLLILTSNEDEAFQLLGRIVTLDDPFSTPAQAEKANQTPVPSNGIARTLIDMVVRSDRLAFQGPESVSIGMPVFLAFSMVVLAAFLPLSRGYVIEGSEITAHDLMMTAIVLFAGFILVSPVLAPGSLLVTFLIPARLIRASAIVFAWMQSTIAAKLIKPRIWPFLRSSAQGLEGYPFSDVCVNQAPVHIISPFYKVEILPHSVVANVLKDRAHGLSNALEQMTSSFAQERVSLPDVQNLLLQIALDTSIVHSVYYQDPYCTSRIAKWIAITEAQRSKNQERNGYDIGGIPLPNTFLMTLELMRARRDLQTDDPSTVLHLMDDLISRLSSILRVAEFEAPAEDEVLADDESALFETGTNLERALGRMSDVTKELSEQNEILNAKIGEQVYNLDKAVANLTKALTDGVSQIRG